MTGPVTDPPPSGPGKGESLDPDSAKGREVAARLSLTLAEIEREIETAALAGRIGRVAA